jgi:hypothetical protein
VPNDRLSDEHAAGRGILARGEVAERSNAAVLKTVDRKVRGFESHPLRQANAG